jgi:hypothetical protein
MAQQILGGLTTLNLATNLDPMFTELYQVRTLLTPSGNNLALGGTPVSNGAGTTSYTVNGSTMAAVEFTLAGAQRGFMRTTDASLLLGTLHSAPVNILVGASNRLTVANGSVHPGLDNAESSGLVGNRWSVVYAVTGAINTSDAREKTDVRAMSSDEISAAKELGQEIGVFKFLASISEKGEEARQHIGLTVQRAIEIMSSHGLSPFSYAFICHDKWDARVEPAKTEQRDTGLKNSNGEPLMEEFETEPEKIIPAGDRYGFRYDQLALFIMRGLEARISALEA